MDFTTLTTERRQSDRRNIETRVEPEKLRQCLEAARMAPSASNAQPWSFVVAEEQALANGGSTRYIRQILIIQ